MTQALQSPFVSSGQLVVVLQHPALQKHEDHSIMTAVLTEVFIFDDKKKRINHYDLLFAFPVESSTNHSRDSSLLSLL